MHSGDITLDTGFVIRVADVRDMNALSWVVAYAPDASTAKKILVHGHWVERMRAYVAEVDEHRCRHAREPSSHEPPLHPPMSKLHLGNKGRLSRSASQKV